MDAKPDGRSDFEADFERHKWTDPHMQLASELTQNLETHQRRLQKFLHDFNAVHMRITNQAVQRISGNSLSHEVTCQTITDIDQQSPSIVSLDGQAGNGKIAEIGSDKITFANNGAENGGMVGFVQRDSLDQPPPAEKKQKDEYANVPGLNRSQTEKEMDQDDDHGQICDLCEGLEDLQDLNQTSSTRAHRASFLQSQVDNIKAIKFGFPHYKRHSLSWYCKGIARSKIFEAACVIVIFGNAVTIGIDSDLSMKYPHDSQDGTLHALENFFAVWYAVELLIRIGAWRGAFFFHHDWRWHVFDSILVLVALYELIMSIFEFNNLNMTFIRIVRVMKISKMFRVVRITKVFRELRLIIHAIQGSAATMFWSSVLLILTTYLFGLAFLQACSNHLRDKGEKLSVKEQDQLRTFWGSMMQSMLSLYWASTGGESWRYVAEPLKGVGDVYYFLFIFYVAFFELVIVNTLTSLFLEATLRNAETDQSQAIQDAMREKAEYTRAFKMLFELVDTDGSGEITLQEFADNIASPEMDAFAVKVGLDIQDVASFFDTLSDSGARPVNLSSFISGCMKLKGAAKSMDLMSLVHVVHFIKDELVDVKRLLGADLQDSSKSAS